MGVKMTDLDRQYVRGLADLGDGCYAWLEPPGSWGLANSGIVAASGEVLVIDTQNDVPMARALQEAVTDVAGQPEVTTVVNTHSDGDHWNGNMMFEGARIIASAATLEEMQRMWLSPADLAAFATPDTAFGRFVDWRTQAFDYTDWHPLLPIETFVGEMTVSVGDARAELLQVGPAHTAGDTMVFISSSGVLYAGDVLFTRSTPIMWVGPMSRCIAACDRMIQLEPRAIVPGHGPIVGTDGVREMRGYLEFAAGYAADAFDAGKSPEQAYHEMDLGPYASWPHASRVYQSVYLVYNERDPDRFPIDQRKSMEIILSTDDDPRWRDDTAKSESTATE
jgi:cyclase